MQAGLIPDEFRDMAATILANIGDGVISTDLSGRIIYMNHMAEEILCCHAAGAIGTMFDDVFTIYDIDTKEPVKSPVAFVLEQMAQTGLKNNTVLIFDNQEEKYISATCTPIYNAISMMMGVVVVFRDITKLKKYELLHLNEENNLKVIFDNTPAGMVLVDKNNVILRANATVMKYLQKDMENLLGKPFGRAICCINCIDNMGCLVGDHCTVCEVGRAVKAAYQFNENTVNIEIKMRLFKEEKEIEAWFRLSVNPIITEGEKLVAVTLVDISSYKFQEINAIEAKDYVENILDQLPFHIWMSDDKFQWKYTNKSNDKAIITDSDENSMSSWNDFIYPEDENAFWKAINEALWSRKGFALEARVRRKDVGYQWGLILGSPYYEAGKYTGYIGSIHDISDRKEAEADLKRYQDLLITAKEAAETANKAKSDFLANISHEIRTPINGMVGMIDLTLLTELNEDQKDNLITAKACTNSLLKIVNDVLDFSKMEAGKMTLENTSFEIRELVEEVIRAHSTLVLKRGLELNYSFSSSVPQYLNGDPNRLRQIFNNLISNAIKFTEHGEVLLTIKSIAANKDEVELMFSVKDTGIGIAKENLAKLFQSFSQIENTFTKRYSGTGLGLVITKQLVEMMGGKIDIDSEFGKGSNFHFNLKFKTGKRNYVNDQTLSITQKTPRPLHILLVEDDFINQKVIRKMLLEKGHTVTTANDGYEALEQYAKDTYDVILMDIQLPMMNGIDAAHKIGLCSNNKKRPPIVAITAYALTDDRERFLNMGMDAYISKPIHMDELFFILEQVTSDTIDITPRNFHLTESGEVVCTTDEVYPKFVINTDALSEIKEKINRMKEAVILSNMDIVEKLANRIKAISEINNFSDIKDTAFKIELAIRRGNKAEAIKYIEVIKKEIKIYLN